jgi:nitroreductase
MQKKTSSFERPVTDLIEARTSWRSYDPRPLEDTLRRTIEEFLEKKTAGPFGHRARFRLVVKNDLELEKNVRLGTYGFIKNARCFIVGAARPGFRHWEDYGYLLEEIILKMTDLGLATCWLGGTFRRGEFGQTVAVTEDEVIPAITPVGYPSRRRNIRDRAIRLGAGSSSRKPWGTFFFDRDFDNPLSQDKPGEYGRVLEMVRLAPSASNRQPWRIVRLAGGFHLFLRRTPNYSAFDRSIDLQRVDMGIAMCHLELTALERGLKGRWEDSAPDIRLPELTEYIATWRTA